MREQPFRGGRRESSVLEEKGVRLQEEAGGAASEALSLGPSRFSDCSAAVSSPVMAGVPGALPGKNSSSAKPGEGCMIASALECWPWDDAHRVGTQEVSPVKAGEAFASCVQAGDQESSGLIGGEQGKQPPVRSSYENLESLLRLNLGETTSFENCCSQVASLEPSVLQLGLGVLQLLLSTPRDGEWIHMWLQSTMSLSRLFDQASNMRCKGSWFGHSDERIFAQFQ